MRWCRPWAATLTLCSGLALAAASGSEQTGVHGWRAPDGGALTHARDGGIPRLAAPGDSGVSPHPLTLEDVEVLENLELLEHLPESEFLDVLLPLRDE